MIIKTAAIVLDAVTNQRTAVKVIRQITIYTYLPIHFLETKVEPVVLEGEDSFLFVENY